MCRCEARHMGISFHCRHCDFDLCVDCYAQDVALVRQEDCSRMDEQAHDDNCTKMPLVYGVSEIFDLFCLEEALSASSFFTIGG